MMKMMMIMKVVFLWRQRPLPCRVSAAQTLMLCVRSERRARQRSALCGAIVGELMLAGSCHRRMLFLRVCPILVDLLSRRFFRQRFLLPLLALAGSYSPLLTPRLTSTDCGHH